MADYDAIVIGASCDGLVAAGALAKQGRRVLVCEARERAGGRLRTDEISGAPGFKVSPVLPLYGGMSPDVVRGLDLLRHGLEERSVEPGATLLRRDDRPLHLPAGRKEQQAAAAKLSERDARGHEQLSRLLGRVVPILRSLLVQEPLPFSRPSLREVITRAGAPWRSAAKRAWDLRSLGEADLLELLRIAPQPLTDFAEDWFQTEGLRAMVVLPALRGSFLGPYSPGGVANLLLWEALNHSRLGRGALPRGGMGAVGLSLLRGAEAAGASVRTNARVNQVRCEGGRALGVVLEGGEQIDAACVIAAGDVRRALLELVDPLALGLSVRPRIESFRSQGTVARIHYALDGLPEAPSGLDPANVIQLGESLDELERAFDDAKYGRASAEPWLELVIPSLFDPALAPSGKHVATAWVQHAPRTLREGSWDELRDPFADRVQARIEAAWPGFAGRITAREVLTPDLLEQRYGLSGGHVFGGELALDQLFTNRPDPSCGRYTTPVDNLFLTGSGTHPGGHLGGTSGWNAAQRILREWSAVAARAR